MLNIRSHSDHIQELQTDAEIGVLAQRKNSSVQKTKIFNDARVNRADITRLWGIVALLNNCQVVVKVSKSG